MKNLITSMACMIILMAFILQFIQNQIIHNQIMAVDQEIHSFKEIVKQDGCILKDNEEKLKIRLSEIVDCSQSEVVIKGDRQLILRGNPIHYEVTIPIEGVVSMAKFWGISAEENSFDYKIDQYTTSENIGRKR